MTELVLPDTRFHSSFLEALAEFSSPDELHGSGDYSFPFDGLDDPARFAGLVEALRADARPETPRPTGFVPCSYFWIVDGERFLGFLAIRHELNEFLLREGGHVGYSVRPTARQRGIATAALAAALPLAVQLGIPRVLLTCEEDNAASRAIIERCGGVYEGTRVGKRRYWIDAARG